MLALGTKAHPTSASREAAQARCTVRRKCDALCRRQKKGRYVASLLQQQVDCSGWRLVVTGHSLGAGAASLVALKLHGTFPGQALSCAPPARPALQRLVTAWPTKPASTACVHLMRMQPLWWPKLHVLPQVNRTITLSVDQMPKAGTATANPCVPSPAACADVHAAQTDLLARPLSERLHAGVTCWAFSPPGGLMSVPLAQAVSDFTVSVVCGKDAVPRTSVSNIGRLLDEMVALSPASLPAAGLMRCRVWRFE